MLQVIERATRKKIEQMQLPTTADINDKRIIQFKQNITDALAADETGFYLQLVEQYHREHNIPPLEIAAALAKLLQGDIPLLLKDAPVKTGRQRGDKGRRSDKRSEHDRSEKSSERGSAVRRTAGKRTADDDNAGRRRHADAASDAAMERYRIEVGRKHKVKPGNIVGAIANEAGLDSQYIKRIVIHDDYSTVELPKGMPQDIYKTLKKAWVCGTQLNISVDGEAKKPRKKLHINKRRDAP